MAKTLTTNQRLFCEEYLKDRNGTRAYKAAYPNVKNENVASVAASNLLRNIKISEYLAKRLNELHQEKMADADEVLEYLTTVLRSESESEEVIATKHGAEKVRKKPSERDRLDASKTLLKYHGLDRSPEQREKDRLELEAYKAEQEKEAQAEFAGIPADQIAPAFCALHHDIRQGLHQEYVLPGGRGSTKSSVISFEIINLLEKNPEMHAVVIRRVANTLRDSVYNQIRWAVEMLGLEEEYRFTTSPLEVTKKSTKQKIYFRGADDPMKIKSIKPPFGFLGILWFEELDQFQGPESIRKMEQSVIRGGDKAYVFKSFNPPRTKSNWANQYILLPKPNRLTVDSNYLSVPKDWLGQPFIDEAEFLKEVNPDAYENEYLGVANGSGGNVFENIVQEEITTEQINTEFDRFYSGVDWGWYPDPFAFVRCAYKPAQQELYIFDEFRTNKMRNEDTAEEVRKRIGPDDVIYCDSADNKSVADYKAYGINARSAGKGPGSREYSFKWLQSLRKIVIDPERCPETLKEFVNYEYERNSDGDIITGYPDGKDHSIDAVRYATFPIWRKKGQ